MAGESSPSIDELFDMLQKADAAGEKEDAAAIAAMIRETQGASGDTSAAPVAQDTSLGRYPKLLMNATTLGLNNLFGLPGTIRDLIGPARVPGAKAPLVSTGVYGGGEDMLNLLPSSRQLTAATNKAGVTNRPEALPYSWPERYGTAAIQGGIGALGGGPGVLATGALAGMAGQGAHELAPNSTLAPIAAATAVGLTSGGIVNAVANSRARSAATLAVTDAEAWLKNAKENVFFGRRGSRDYVNNLRAANDADFAATQGKLVLARDEQIEALDNTLEGLAGKYGAAKTLQEAGTELQNSARSWIQNVLPERLGEIWKSVDEVVPKATPVQLGKFELALKDITTSSGKLEPLSALLKPKAPSALLKALGEIKDSAKAKAELTGEAAQPFTWAEVQKLRSTLGDAMHDPKLVADIGQKNMKRLYASLTDDMRAAAQTQGDEALMVFDDANQQSTKLYDIAEGPMAKIISSPTGAGETILPEKAAEALLRSGKAGASDLAVLRAELPQAMGNLSAAALRNNRWGVLAPEAKQALLPDASASAIADRILVDKQLAKELSGKAIKIAQENRKANIEAAKRAAQEQTDINDLGVKSAREALQEAKLAMPEQPAPLLDFSRGHELPTLARIGAGGGLGYAADLGLTALGMPGNKFLNAGLGIGLAAGAPVVARAAKGYARNPALLAYPASAALAGDAINLNELAVRSR